MFDALSFPPAPSRKAALRGARRAGAFPCNVSNGHTIGSEAEEAAAAVVLQGFQVKIQKSWSRTWMS